MKDGSKKGGNPKPAATTEKKPQAVSEELAPLIEWWGKSGRQYLMAISIAVIAGSLFFIWRHMRDAQASEAAIAASDARSIDELEGIVNKYGKTTTGIAVRLRLAKAFYDADKFEDALAAYDEFLKLHSTHPLASIATVGRAAALEGLNRLVEAEESFKNFRTGNADHFLAPVAWLGEARCMALRGQKQEAVALLDELKLAKVDTPWEQKAKSLQGVIERYDGRSLAPVSLFDQANLLQALTPPEEVSIPIGESSTEAPPAEAQQPEPQPETQP